ncbi:MAG: alanine--tRNA ligase [Spirochaetales bacterium]|nr:alanine--tRNA ligase [Spirochaetales bacterium]
MDFKELRNKYVSFFESKGHKHISSSSLIPENDPTVLFTTAGMHPLVPYLLGQPHPEGKRLVDWQKCIRTGDIDDVGDPAHLTFFEMLGNWSLGDYFKKEAISWSYEFLIKELGFKPEQLHVTVFEGDADAPRDEESAGYWESLGIPKERIHFKPKEDNWWGPAGTTGPCGPDTEMFIDTGLPACSDKCGPGCHCGKYIEIWNNVFMQYNKQEDGTFIPLSQKNVDTGMGIERTVAMLSGKKSVYETDIFKPIINKIEQLSGTTYGSDEDTSRAIRIIADHIRTATFIIGDERGISPSNVGAGYVLRRLIRRSVRFGKKLGINKAFLADIAQVVIDMMSQFYPELIQNKQRIFDELSAEEAKFETTLQTGLNEFNKVAGKLAEHNQTGISGKTAFKLYDTYGFPLELTLELAKEKNMTVDVDGFNEQYTKHKEESRTASKGTFKAGLADHAEETTNLHSATHLLHAALRKVLGDHVQQKGSNITQERLRFDFSHPQKVTPEQLKEVEDLVNEQIQKKMPITMEVMTLEEAKAQGALAFFTSKYGEKVKVYTMGDFSKEVCGGPHAQNTGDLGRFVIKKEEASSAGVRRIKAVLVKE